jgi:hypothetical protein
MSHKYKKVDSKKNLFKEKSWFVVSNAQEKKRVENEWTIATTE